MLIELSLVNRGPWPGFHPNNAGAAEEAGGVAERATPKREEMDVCMSVVCET